MVAISAKIGLTLMAALPCDLLTSHRHRNQGGAGEPGPPPIFYPWDFINIHACSTDRCDHRVYYVWPPQNGIASYAYASDGHTKLYKLCMTTYIVTRVFFVNLYHRL